MLARFDLAMPADLEEALAILAEGAGAANDDDGVMPLAGGTNMLVDLRARRVAPNKLIGLTKVDALRGVEVRNGRVSMGARTTVTDILRNPAIKDAAPSLVESAGVFAGQMVRNTATVAGNICCGSPAADLVPPLLTLDAEVTLASASGSRVVPLAQYFTGYKQDARRPDELMTKIEWERPAPNSANLFYKLARRKGDAITVVGVGVTLTAKGGRCSKARIALGAVAPTIFRAVAAEQMLVGEVSTPDLIEASARQAMEAASPIDDVRASAEYRSHCVHVLTRRLLTQAWENIS